MLQYFVEIDTPRADVERLRAWGLAYAFAGTAVASPFSGAGPGGTRGTVLAANSESIGYYPERQRWQRVPALFLQPDAPRCWVGRWIDRPPPTPDELARTPQLDGHLVRLADHQDWRVPIARGWIEEDGDCRYYCALPGRATLDEAGQWTPGEIEPRFAPLWQLGEHYWEWRSRTTIDASNEVRFSFSEMLNQAVRALAFNYRLGPAEAALLGLFDDQQRAALAVLDAVIDLATLEQWLQKKSPAGAGCSTSAGDSGTIATTDPPSPT